MALTLTPWLPSFFCFLRLAVWCVFVNFFIPQALKLRFFKIWFASTTMIQVFLSHCYISIIKNHVSFYGQFKMPTVQSIGRHWSLKGIFFTSIWHWISDAVAITFLSCSDQGPSLRYLLYAKKYIDRCYPNRFQIRRARPVLVLIISV